MDMVKGYGDKNPVVDKSQFVLSLYERITDDRYMIGPKEKSILDRCVERVYSRKRQYEIPTFFTLRRVLQEQDEPEAKDLALMLELFTDGTLNNFSHPTNIETENRLISFNTRGMVEDMKDLGQLVITDHMINRVSQNWENGVRTHIFLDEFHTLLEAYEPLIRQYARQYGIEEYVELIKAVMMQESGGQGSDPMQASECGYNTRYPNTPNGITDPEYSIDVGIQNLAACLREAGVENPVDMNHIKLALQGYNYGNGYISWAKENYGGYTYANAVEFSEMMAERNGWSSYGDKEYVSHVLRYYVFGRIPTGTGSQAIVQVALTQEGNGGDTYWSWYGFSSREEWCACFVSWCADQCGYIEAGVIPKFSLCSAGMEWFESRGQFMDGSYVPASGDLVSLTGKMTGVSTM